MSTIVIPKSIIRAGLRNGIIEIINNSADGCVSAQIGDMWFYFAGAEDEDMDAKLYAQSVGEDALVDMIYETLCDFKEAGDNGEDCFLDEWKYYRAKLLELNTDKYKHKQ